VKLLEMRAEDTENGKPWDSTALGALLQVHGGD
jgi:hypothetical protein